MRLDENVINSIMYFTSYCQTDPILSNLTAARASMSVHDLVDIEDALQRWGKIGPEEGHIYGRVNQSRHDLARSVAHVNRFLVGVHDLRPNEIIVVSMDAGPIQNVVRVAYLYLGPNSGTITPNPQWTG